MTINDPSSTRTSRSRLSRAAVAATVVTAVAALGPTPADALVGPTTRDTSHPASGVMLPSPSASVPKICGATLVAPRVVVIAGHCAAYRLRVLGDTRARISFDTDLTDGVDGQVHAGTLALSPSYRSQPLDHDLGLVLLDEPVEGITPATLPPAGWLADTTADEVTLVAYGVSAVGRGVKLTTDNHIHGLTQRWLIAGSGKGEGNSCDQDSGGSGYVDGVLAAIVSWGDSACANTTGLTRLDRAEDLAWIGEQVELTSS